MRFSRIPLLALALLAAVSLADAPPANYPFPKRGTVPVLDQAGIEKMIANNGHRLLVVNLWATWCAPCVAELPYFQDAHEDFAKNDVQVTALSMDLQAYEDQWPEYTNGTVNELGLDFPIFQLDINTTVTNEWFSKKWQGALPVTFYYDAKGNKLGEHLSEITKEELYEEIGHYLAKTDPNPHEPEPKKGS